jgi:hypothetical protein
MNGNVESPDDTASRTSAVIKAELGHVHEDVAVGDHLVDAVEEPPRQRDVQGLLAAVADAVDDVVPALPAVQEQRDHLRWVLAVGVDEDDGVARGLAHAGDHARLVAVVARQRQQLHARVARAQLAHLVGGGVGRAVVAEQDLEPVAVLEGRQHLRQSLVEDGKRHGLVVDGRHDRHPAPAGLAHPSFRDQS